MLPLIALAFALNSVQVTPTGFDKASEPQLAIDGDHGVYVTYGMGNSTYLSVSKDAGATFGQPIKVVGTGQLALGMRRGPRVAVYGGTVTITAMYANQGGGRDGDILAFRSNDRGATWKGPVRVNGVEGAAREGLHAMAAAPDGTLACTWLDLRTQGTKLYLAVSKDGGASWSENRLAYASPSGTICQCCHPSITFDAKGNLYVMFRNVIQGARDLYLTSSSDLGRTFSPAIKLGTGTWMLDACPMDGGSLAVTATGEVQAVWRREGVLYRSGASGAEVRLADGQQGWLALGSAGTYLAWSAGKRLVASTPSGSVAELSDNGTEAVVASSPDHGLVLAAWAQGGIRAARPSD